MNVPKLRFVGFKDDYFEYRLNDITEIIKDGTHGTHENVFDGIPLLSAKDIYDNIIHIPEDCRKISTEDYNKIYNNYHLKENDILMTIVGTIGRTALYKNENVAFQRSVATIRVDNINNPNYVRNYLESSNVSNQLTNMTNSSAQGGIYLNSLAKIKLSLPSKEEQLKVSNFLTLLDKNINLQSKKIEDLKLFKLCIMKSIFASSELDNQIKFKEVAIIEKGKQVNSESLLDQGDYYMLNGGTSPSGYLNEYNRNENTITISEGGNSCGYVNFNKEKFWCGGHCYSVLPKNIDNCYLYQILKFNEKSIMDLRVGSGIPNIQKKDIENYNLNIHNNDKQKDIAIMLSKYDLKINLEEKFLFRLQELKKGLMQSMFV